MRRTKKTAASKIELCRETFSASYAISFLSYVHVSLCICVFAFPQYLVVSIMCFRMEVVFLSLQVSSIFMHFKNLQVLLITPTICNYGYSNAQFYIYLQLSPPCKQGNRSIAFRFSFWYCNNLYVNCQSCFMYWIGIYPQSHIWCLLKFIGMCI